MYIMIDSRKRKTIVAVNCSKSSNKNNIFFVVYVGKRFLCTLSLLNFVFKLIFENETKILFFLFNILIII